MPETRENRNLSNVDWSSFETTHGSIRRLRLSPESDWGDGRVIGEAGRYQILGEIARGGMGAVLKGRDPDLNRDLAIKVLLEKFADNSCVVHRFVDEAQIGGQLQHPGIVPVYEMGQFPNR